MIEAGLYKNKELAKLMDIDPNQKNLKRNIQSGLKMAGLEWDKDFKFPKNGSILIINPPDVLLQKMRYICRKIGLDERINMVSFSIFVYCYIKKEDFKKSIWENKRIYLNKEYGINVSRQTLNNWANKIKDADSKILLELANVTEEYLNGRK